MAKMKQLPLPTMSKPRKSSDPTMAHWAVAAYREAMRTTPTPAARTRLIERIEELSLTTEAWLYALDTWVLNGYAKSNIAGMLDYANEHPGGAAGPTVRARKPVDELVTTALKVAPESLATVLEWEQDALPVSEESEWEVRRFNESQEGLFS